MAVDPKSNVVPIASEQNTAEKSAESASRLSIARQVSSKLSAAERVAIVAAMLGEDMARPVMDKLKDHELNDISEALERISRLNKNDLLSVVMEFLEQMKSSSDDYDAGRREILDLVPSIVCARQEEKDSLSNFATVATAGDDTTEEIPLTDDLDTWGRLAKREPAEIVTYLDRLSPNLISMILRRLPTEIASDLISRLKEDKLKPLVSFLVEPDECDEEVNAILAKTVELEFLNVQETGGEEKTEHLDELGEILSLIKAERRATIISFLEADYEGKLEGIQKSIFSIEKLPDMLPRKAVPIVTRDIDFPSLTRLAASLKGKYEPVADFILSNISSRLAGNVRAELQEFADLSPEEIEDEHKNFLTQLMELRRQGAIDLD
ncbi:MAG: FliG C-terminal domain-containing protein [Pseudomonadota bacterium]